MRRTVSVAFPLALLIAAAACGGQAPVSKTPELPTDKQTRCSVAKSQSHPLIVEWPSADRLTLEARMRKGIVPVRYAGCEMELLEQCSLGGQYAYAALNKQKESLTLRTVDDLYAKLPLGAASLEGQLESSGELGLAMSMVGRFEWSGVSSGRACRATRTCKATATRPRM